MKVFISWSGARSRQVAQELGPWLKKVVQSLEPWVSTDMERGVKWIAVVNESLDEHSFGLICVTPENVNAPWINYEAGALAKHLVSGGRVIPYLLDFKSPSDLKDPLAQFNASLADEEGTWQIIKTLNAHAEFQQNEPELKEAFGLWWPKFETRLTQIRTSSSQAPARRSQDDKIDELLSIARELARSGAFPRYAIGWGSQETTVDDQGRTRATIDPDQVVIQRLPAHEQRYDAYRSDVLAVTDRMFGKKETRGLRITWLPESAPTIEMPIPLTETQLDELIEEVESRTGIRPDVLMKEK